MIVFLYTIGERARKLF